MLFIFDNKAPRTRTRSYRFLCKDMQPQNVFQNHTEDLRHDGKHLDGISSYSEDVDTAGETSVSSWM